MIYTVLKVLCKCSDIGIIHEWRSRGNINLTLWDRRHPKGGREQQGWSGAAILDAIGIG